MTTSRKLPVLALMLAAALGGWGFYHVFSFRSDPLGIFSALHGSRYVADFADLRQSAHAAQVAYRALFLVHQTTAIAWGALATLQLLTAMGAGGLRTNRVMHRRVGKAYLLTALTCALAGTALLPFGRLTDVVFTSVAVALTSIVTLLGVYLVYLSIKAKRDRHFLVRHRRAVIASTGPAFASVIQHILYALLLVCRWNALFAWRFSIIASGVIAVTLCILFVRFVLEAPARSARGLATAES